MPVKFLPKFEEEIGGRKFTRWRMTTTKTTTAEKLLLDRYFAGLNFLSVAVSLGDASPSFAILGVSHQTLLL